MTTVLIAFAGTSIHRRYNATTPDLTRQNNMISVLLMTASSSPISIVLSVPSSTVKSGNEVIFAALVKNLTNQPIEMVCEGDSMNFHGKAPYVNLEARQADGQWVNLIMKNVGRCGNTNPLTAADFVRIESGKSDEILKGMPWTKYEVAQCLKNPGKYTIRLKYDSTPPFKRWLGGPLIPGEAQKQASNLKPHYDLTPKGAFLSNEVTLLVE